MYCRVTILVSKYRLAVERWVVDRVQLDWAEYIVKNASDWQVFRLGLLLKEVGTGMITRLCNKAKDVCGKSSAPLESELNCVMILPVPGNGTTIAAWKGTP